MELKHSTYQIKDLFLLLDQTYSFAKNNLWQN